MENYTNIAFGFAAVERRMKMECSSKNLDPEFAGTSSRENFQFARQAGATHVVTHLVDEFKGGAKTSRQRPVGAKRGRMCFGGWQQRDSRM